MQTGYQGITTLYKNLLYDGGFCEWYYVPIDDIATEPVLGTSQELTTEPSLKAGKSWYGPVKVPDNSLGFVETQEQSKAGIYYKQKVEGYQVGDGRANRVILENMPYYKYVIVAKKRAGGFFVYLGSVESPFDFDHNHDSGKGSFTTSKTSFSFSGESLNKALILPSFEGQTSMQAPDDLPGGSGSGGGSGDGTNNDEIIPFTGVSVVNIDWNSTRKGFFGSFPLIQVWFKDGSIYNLANTLPISCDAAPPDTTLFTIDLTGVSEGFIQIK